MSHDIPEDADVESTSRRSGFDSSGILAGFVRPVYQHHNKSATVVFSDRGCGEFGIELCLCPFDHREGWNLSCVLLLHGGVNPDLGRYPIHDLHGRQNVVLAPNYGAAKLGEWHGHGRL